MERLFAIKIRPPSPATIWTIRSNSSTILKQLLTIGLCMNILTAPVLAEIHQIYWNTSNPIFHIDNIQHSFVTHIGDTVEFYCPSDPDDPQRFLLVHEVNFDQYEQCRLDLITSGDKLKNPILACAPLSRKPVIFNIRETRVNNPSVPNIHIGQQYYFITTSNGTQNGLENVADGLCSEKKLKIRFKVLNSETPINGGSGGSVPYGGNGGEDSMTNIRNPDGSLGQANLRPSDGTREGSHPKAVGTNGQSVGKFKIVDEQSKPKDGNSEGIQNPGQHGSYVMVTEDSAEEYEFLNSGISQPHLHSALLCFIVVIVLGFNLHCF